MSKQDKPIWKPRPSTWLHEPTIKTSNSKDKPRREVIRAKLTEPFTTFHPASLEAFSLPMREKISYYHHLGMSRGHAIRIHHTHGDAVELVCRRCGTKMFLFWDDKRGIVIPKNVHAFKPGCSHDPPHSKGYRLSDWD